MKFDVEVADLLRLVSEVGKATAGRTTKPALSGVKLTAQDDTLTATATDLDVALRGSVPARVKAAGGCVVVQWAKLVAILKETGGRAEVSCDGEKVRVKVTGGRYDLPAADPAEFPDFPDSAEVAAFTAPCDGLVRAVRQSVYAASRKDNNPRFATHGVLFEATERAVQLVGTDTKRIGAGGCDAVVRGEWPAKCLVPSRALSLLEAMLAAGGEVVATAGVNDVRFRVGDSELWSRLLEGVFPPWKQIVPKKFAHTFPIDFAAFSAATGRAAITSDDENKRVDYQFAAGAVSMTAHGAETGRSDVACDVPGCPAEFPLALDPVYVKQASDAFLRSGATECEMGVTDGSRPVMWKWHGGMALIMPMGERS